MFISIPSASFSTPPFIPGSRLEPISLARCPTLVTYSVTCLFGSSPHSGRSVPAEILSPFFGVLRTYSITFICGYFAMYMGRRGSRSDGENFGSEVWIIELV
ncbi:hypothetical protein QCA50_007507 [Cerrena zonata]|uniref:Uncharacterized protein n=1 Tax=Cerrena zonata TaxID=2478898 RepID=A0AAW0GFB9_9APHY